MLHCAKPPSNPVLISSNQTLRLIASMMGFNWVISDVWGGGPGGPGGPIEPGAPWGPVSPYGPAGSPIAPHWWEKYKAAKKLTMVRAEKMILDIVDWAALSGLLSWGIAALSDGFERGKKRLRTLNPSAASPKTTVAKKFGFSSGKIVFRSLFNMTNTRCPC